MNKQQLKNIAEFAYKTMFRQAPDLSDIQETFYGWVVFLGSNKGRVVVKFSREIGRLAKEVEGLERLRRVLPCPVPKVLFFGREEGYNYLMMDWLDGVSAHNLPQDQQAITAFRESYLDLLLALHDQKAAPGFEIGREKYARDLPRAFESWMGPVFRYVMSSGSAFSQPLKDAYSQAWEMKDNILSTASPESSLVHDDCHVGNVLFDPKTYQVSAILDPCDVGYKHREMDLFHLFDVRSDLQLAECYQAHHRLDDGFEMRRWFFSVWDDAKHSRNMGWYDEAWLQNKFDHFHQALNHQGL
ncbi:phosphotransferase [Photobacterium japonica]|uniref:phosphotransferase n=1 Tax=Photobacterium japonica TaxID=2910235 RepID=UPI003D0BF0BA